MNIKTYTCLILIYSTISLTFLFPIFKDPIHNTPDTGDTFHNIWIMGLNSKKILNKQLSLSSGNIYYPENTNVLNYSEKLYIQSILFLPFYVIKNPILGYNIQLLFSFIFSALLCFYIFYKISNNKRLAFVSSIVAVFFPFKFMHLPHLQLLSTQWVLLPLAYLIHIKGDLQNSKQVIILYLLSVPQLISWGYLTIFLYLFLIAILSFSVVYAHTNRIKIIMMSFLYFFLVIISCVYFYYPYITSFKNGNFRTSDEITSYGVDLLQWLTPSSNSKMYQSNFDRFQNISEGISISGLFSGFILFFLVVTSFIKLYLKKSRIVIKFWLDIANKWNVLFLTLLAFFFLTSFGNIVKIGSVKVIKNPVFFLSDILYFGKSLRYLTAYSIPLFICLGALISLTKNKLINNFWVIFSILFLIEAFPSIHINNYQYDGALPDSYQYLNDHPEIATIMEYPINKAISGTDVYYWNQFEYMFYSIYHNKLLVNGLTGFFPNFHRETISLLVNFPDAVSLNRLKKINVNYVLVHNNKLLPADTDRIQRWDLKPIITFSDNSSLYRLN